MRMNRTSPHNGFTIVEVVIAMLIVFVVAAAIAANFGATTRAQLRTKAQQKQSSIAQGIIEELRSNSSWFHVTSDGMLNCPAVQSNSPRPYGRSSDTRHSAGDSSGVCDLTPYLATLHGGDSSGGAQSAAGHLVLADSSTVSNLSVDVTAWAIGIDSVADGTGGEDEDGIVPDLAQVTVVARPVEPTTVQLAPTTLTEMIDVRGARIGSIAISACAISVAVESVAINECTPGTIPISRERGNASRSESRETSSDDLRLRGGGNHVDPSLGDATATIRRLQVSASDIALRPVRNGQPVGTAVAATVRSMADGTLRVTGLEPGRYELRLRSSLRLWTSHTIPGGWMDGSSYTVTHVTVEAHTESNVLLFYTDDQGASSTSPPSSGGNPSAGGGAPSPQPPGCGCQPYGAPIFAQPKFQSSNENPNPTGVDPRLPGG